MNFAVGRSTNNHCASCAMAWRHSGPRLIALLQKWRYRIQSFCFAVKIVELELLGLHDCNINTHFWAFLHYTLHYRASVRLSVRGHHTAELCQNDASCESLFANTPKSARRLRDESCARRASFVAYRGVYPLKSLGQVPSTQGEAPCASKDGEWGGSIPPQPIRGLGPGRSPG